jgi:outer membrane protein OmpA-like peptidoglycan-associated protein
VTRLPVDPLPWSLLLIVALVVSFTASDLADAGARNSGSASTALESVSVGGCSPHSLPACALPGARLALTTSGFAPGSAELPEGMANQLSTLGRALREQRAVVRVEVHTDSSGSPEHSRALSQRRAEAIRGFLIERGVDPYRVHAVGMGAQRPLLPHDPLAAENRRVEIIRL